MARGSRQSQGMKKYVWSETLVEGGKPFKGALAKPPSNTGAFQNLAIQDVLAAPEGSKPIPQFYADAAVIAYRAAASDVPVESLHPKVTASAGTLDAAMLSDGDLQKTTKLPIPVSRRKCLDSIRIRRAPDDALRYHRDEKS